MQVALFDVVYAPALTQEACNPEWVLLVPQQSHGSIEQRQKLVRYLPGHIRVIFDIVEM
ncbi:hypothetical protein D3C85_1839610 [compost metagenome]